MKIHQLLAYLQVNDAPRAIEFYTSVSGATEKLRLTDPNGRIGHAVLDFGGTTLMLAEEFPEYGILGPLTLGGTSVTIHLQVDDADAVIRRAVEAGAEIENEPERVDSGRGQERTLRGVAPVECAIDGWS